MVFSGLWIKFSSLQCLFGRMAPQILLFVSECLVCVLPSKILMEALATNYQIRNQ